MNRGVAGAFLGVAVVLIVFGVLNHYAFHINPVQHTSTIIAVLAAIFGVVGIAGYLMKPSKG